MSLPATLPSGYLPPGVHQAALGEVVDRFGTGTPRRQALAERLREMVTLARATGKLRRLFIWGSFATDIDLLNHLWIGPIPTAFNRIKTEGTEESREALFNGRKRFIDGKLCAQIGLAF